MRCEKGFGIIGVLIISFLILMLVGISFKNIIRLSKTVATIGEEARDSKFEETTIGSNNTETNEQFKRKKIISQKDPIFHKVKFDVAKLFTTPEKCEAPSTAQMINSEIHLKDCILANVNSIYANEIRVSGKVIIFSGSKELQIGKITAVEASLLTVIATRGKVTINAIFGNPNIKVLSWIEPELPGNLKLSEFNDELLTPDKIIPWGEYILKHS